MNKQQGVSYVEALCCLALMGMSTVAVFEGAEAYTEKANDYIASQKQMPKLVHEHLYKQVANGANNSDNSRDSLDMIEAKEAARLSECMSWAQEDEFGPG